MSKYRYEMGEIIRDTEIDFPYHTDDIVELLDEKDKQISELETKLAERNKTIDEINKEFLSVIEDWKQLVEIEKTEKSQLKQQLADMTKKYELASLPVGGLVDTARNLEKQLKTQPAEIVEKIRKWGQKHYNWVGDGTGYDGQDYNECIGFNRAIDQLNGALGTILKEYGENNE